MNNNIEQVQISEKASEQIVLSQSKKNNKKFSSFFSFSLFLTTIKSNIKVWLICTIILCTLLFLMSYIMPNELNKSLQVDIEKWKKNIGGYVENGSFNNVRNQITSDPIVLSMLNVINQDKPQFIPGTKDKVIDYLLSDKLSNINSDTPWSEYAFPLVWLNSVAETFQLQKDAMEPLPAEAIRNAFAPVCFSTNTICEGLNLSSLYGIQTTLNNISSVIVSNFVSMLGVLLGLVYVILVGNALVASQVDRGSMAYILSTPIKRKAVINTQIIFFVSSIVLMAIVCIAINILGMLIANVAIDYLEICIAYFGFALFLTMIGSISFMFSCSFNLSKTSLAFGGGIPVIFYVLTIISQINKVTEGAKYATLNTLFSSNVIENIWGEVRKSTDSSSMGMGSLSSTDVSQTELLYGENVFWYMFLAMFLIAIICFVIGKFVFNKRDLPL